MKKILEDGKVSFHQQTLENGTIVVIRDDKSTLPKNWTLAQQERDFKEEKKKK